MAYVPKNPFVYCAAYAGALAGMSIVGRQPTDTVAANYAGRCVVAGAWASAVDTAWGSNADYLVADLIEEASSGFWAERQPLNAPPFNTASFWANEALAFVAFVTASEAYFAIQGVAAPPLPLGATGYEQVIDVMSSPYNAKGDGVSDDYSAIQSALNALTIGATVFFRGGHTFLVTQPLVLPQIAGAVIPGPYGGYRLLGGCASAQRRLAPHRQAPALAARRAGCPR